MLESEEGQLNAVFACYGSAAQHGQFFEESLTRLIVALNEWSATECEVSTIEKWTIGRLLGYLRKKFIKEIDEWVPQYLDEGRRLRNFLIHDYFLSRKEQISTERGRKAMLEELTAIEQQLRTGAGLINGFRTAIGRAMTNGTAPEREGGDVVLSAEVEIKRPEPLFGCDYPMLPCTSGRIGGVSHRRSKRSALAASLPGVEPHPFTATSMWSRRSSSASPLGGTRPIQGDQRIVQCKDLDEFRGSFHSLNADHQTTITASGIWKGTQVAGFETGVAPPDRIDERALLIAGHATTQAEDRWEGDNCAPR